MTLTNLEFKTEPTQTWEACKSQLPTWTPDSPRYSNDSRRKYRKIKTYSDQICWSYDKPTEVLAYFSYFGSQKRESIVFPCESLLEAITKVKCVTREELSPSTFREFLFSIVWDTTLDELLEKRDDLRFFVKQLEEELARFQREDLRPSLICFRRAHALMRFSHPIRSDRTTYDWVSEMTRKLTVTARNRIWDEAKARKGNNYYYRHVEELADHTATLSDQDKERIDELWPQSFHRIEDIL